MAQDLKKLFEEDRKRNYEMMPGHEGRFLERIDKAMPQQKRKTTFFWFRIAASVMLLLGVGLYYILRAPDNVSMKEAIVEKENPDRKSVV